MAYFDNFFSNMNQGLDVPSSPVAAPSSNPLSMSTSDLIRQQEGIAPVAPTTPSEDVKDSSGHPSEAEMQSVLARSNELSRKQQMIDEARNKPVPNAPPLMDTRSRAPDNMQAGMSAGNPNLGFMGNDNAPAFDPLQVFGFGGK